MAGVHLLHIAVDAASLFAVRYSISAVLRATIEDKNKARRQTNNAISVICQLMENHHDDDADDRENRCDQLGHRLLDRRADPLDIRRRAREQDPHAYAYQNN